MPRRLLAPFCAVMIAAGLPTVAQERDDVRKPRKGDQVVVSGCLKGSMLEATETRLADADGSPAMTPHTFQLKGKKDLLKALREAHDGEQVELTGELRSSLEAPDRRGTQIGRTGIFVGAGTGAPNRPDLGGDRIMPVLDVKSYEGTGVSCRR